MFVRHASEAFWIEFVGMHTGGMGCVGVVCVCVWGGGGWRAGGRVGLDVGERGKAEGERLSVCVQALLCGNKRRHSHWFVMSPLEISCERVPLCSCSFPLCVRLCYQLWGRASLSAAGYGPQMDTQLSSRLYSCNDLDMVVTLLPPYPPSPRPFQAPSSQRSQQSCLTLISLQKLAARTNQMCSNLKMEFRHGKCTVPGKSSLEFFSLHKHVQYGC